MPRGARPTSGRAREALFDILQDWIMGARVLDLFAGSGAIGLEALSRGAAEAVFVETDPEAVDANLARFAPAAGCFEVFAGDVCRAISTLSREGRQFDLVFADPPYSRGISALPGSVINLVASGGRLVLQTDSDEDAPEIPGFTAAEKRAYARNVFWIFERSGA